MSRTVRRELFSTLETLEKANRILKKVLKNGKTEDAISLLTDCQSCAITIGNQIEVIYGNDLDTIHALEDYCEGVYQIAENIASPEEVERKYSQACGQLLTVREMMEKDIPDKAEVVFFPYKASMWDSLESVYLAAKEDENCDAYCVPIPYYDRKTDGSLGEMHYEGNEYPKNIEVIDYRTYNLEERHPDVIYIHNPYDEWNYVTCVPERYFAKNLCKHTDELVYIPYFVLEEIEPDDQRAIDGMKHFCFTPGVIYAHKVIVQSENMRQIYINEYIKEAKENGLSGEHIDRKYLEKKILGLGSPKYDKVLNTKKEDLDIPKEWLKIIEKQDGSWKKIIFYNTSISALLRHDEKMLEKMKDVFRIFKEQKDEVALLWRPHPLIQTTIETMRPQLWAKYRQIVEQYCSEGWGIYDDSADMDRAVILSDAYYGDPSSVVQVYQKTRKPVMIQQEMFRVGEEVWSFLPFDGGNYYDDKIWCMHSSENALYTIDVNTAEVKYIDSFDEENGKSRLFLRLVQDEKSIFLLPGTSEHIIKYDKQNRMKEYYSNKSGKDCFNKYYATVAYENRLYAFPVLEEAILKFGKISGRIDYISLPNIEETSKENFCAKGYFTKRSILVNDMIIIPCGYVDKILIFDLKTEMCIWKEGLNNGIGFVDILSMGDEIFLLDREMRILRTNISLEEKPEIFFYLQEQYRYLLEFGNQILLVPAYDNKISIIDLVEKNQKFINYPSENCFRQEIDSKGILTFSDIAYGDKCTFLIPRFSNMFISIDNDTKKISYQKWRLSQNVKEHLKSLMKLKIEKNEIINECIVPLILFLEN